MIEPVELTDAELASIRHLIPDPEPELGTPRPASPGGWAPERPLMVCETLLDGNERRYVEECIETNWISSAGAFVRRFEAAWAEACGCEHAVACSSGTAAVHLALAAAGVGPGDEVVMPAFTMVSTANAARYLGAEPVFVDSDPVTWNLDVEQVAAAIGPRTRALLPVHIYGHPAEIDPLRELADEHGLALVEDAAESHGARYRGRRVGGIGDAGAFSFYGNKILTTGEGGMVTTNDAAIAARARELRSMSFSPERHFWHRSVAFNYRMGNLQAAVGLAQVERLDDLVARRRTAHERYAEALAEIPGVTLARELPHVTCVFWMHGITVGEDFGVSRDELRRRLAARGIETRTFFVPLHVQPAYFREHAGRGERHPVAEELGRTGLYLPSSPDLTEDEIAYVAAAVAAARG